MYFIDCYSKVVCIKETLHIIPGGELRESVNIIILCYCLYFEGQFC